MVRAARRSLITSARRPPVLRLPPMRTTAQEFGTRLAHHVVSWELTGLLAMTMCKEMSFERDVSRAGRRAGGRPGDVMSDLGAFCMAARFAQCRESRASRARSAESTRSTGRASRLEPL